MNEEKIKQIKQITQTLETWQHIVDFGYGTIEVPDKTKIFKTILNLIEEQKEYIENCEERLVKFQECIDNQQKEIEQLKKPRYIYNAKSGEVTKLESNEETIKLQTENKKLKQTFTFQKQKIKNL